MDGAIQSRAVILMYTGTELSPSGVAALSKTLSDYVSLGVLQIEHFEFDSEDLAEAAILSTIKSCTESKAVEQTRVSEVENAVMTFSTQMEEYLGRNYKAETFVFAIVKVIKDGGKTKPDLFKSIQILSETDDLNVSSRLLRKYRLDEKKIKIIREVWNLSKI